MHTKTMKIRECENMMAWTSLWKRYMLYVCSLENSFLSNKRRIQAWETRLTHN